MSPTPEVVVQSSHSIMHPTTRSVSCRYSLCLGSNCCPIQQGWFNIVACWRYMAQVPFAQNRCLLISDAREGFDLNRWFPLGFLFISPKIGQWDNMEKYGNMSLKTMGGDRDPRSWDPAQEPSLTLPAPTRTAELFAILQGCPGSLGPRDSFASCHVNDLSTWTWLKYVKNCFF